MCKISRHLLTVFFMFLLHFVFIELAGTPEHIVKIVKNYVHRMVTDAWLWYVFSLDRLFPYDNG